MRLGRKITLFTSILIIFLVLLVGIFMMKEWINSLQSQMGKDTIDLAITISHSQIVQENINIENGYIKIQNYIENLRLNTRVQYIYVVNMDSKIYAHPYLEKLNSHMANDFLKEVLSTGKSRVKVGKINEAIEAYVPIYFEGEQAGAVIVGILNGRLIQEISVSIIKFTIYLTCAIFLGLIFAYWLAKNIKKTIYGLEPKEIAFLLGQKEIVLENLNEGIIALNQLGDITLVNKSAKDLMNLSDYDLGKNISYYSFKDGFIKVLNSRQQLLSKEIRIGKGKTLLGNFFPLYNNNKLVGVLASFEDLTLAKQRAEELTGMKNLTNALRAQNHEFMNKLHTISGLIQLEEYSEAINFISKTAETRQEILEILSNQIKIPSLAGLLFAKYNKASEMKIQITIDPCSRLNMLPQGMTNDDICSIVGNLVENSLDELTGKPNGKIFIGIFQNKNLLNINVIDNGRGVPKEIEENIFEFGKSSKGSGRGYGLWLVKNIVEEYIGKISYRFNKGAMFEINIPFRKEHL